MTLGASGESGNVLISAKERTTKRPEAADRVGDDSPHSPAKHGEAARRFTSTSDRTCRHVDVELRKNRLTKDRLGGRTSRASSPQLGFLVVESELADEQCAVASAERDSYWRPCVEGASGRRLVVRILQTDFRESVEAHQAHGRLTATRHRSQPASVHQPGDQEPERRRAEQQEHEGFHPGHPTRAPTLLILRNDREGTTSITSRRAPHGRVRRRSYSCRSPCRF